MQGISSKALNGVVDNKKKYNGIDWENEFDLAVYDALYRELDPQTGRWWQIDPVTDGYEEFSPYASNYNNPIKFSDPLGDEGTEGNGGGGCCDFLKDAANFVGGFVVGTTIGIIDNVTGTNARSQLAPAFAGTGAAGHGWNTGLGTADVGGVVLGVHEIVAGGGIAAGGGGLTLVTAGTSSPVTVPVALGGAAIATHGGLTIANSMNNLVNQNGRVDASSKQTGSYTNTHQSGKTYSGKGPESRAKESARSVEKTHKDPVKNTDWKPSKNNREAFKAEDKRIEKTGGAGNKAKNYNQRNSPGKKYNEQDK
jgi:RHS repeat-associated protein